MAIPPNLSEVPNINPYIQYVSGSGQTVFPYPFPITQDSDLIAVVNGVTLNTDSGYTLSGQGNDTGGNLTFTLGQTAGVIVTLFRDIPIQRVTQIGQNSGFSSTAFNAEYNNIYLILQQLETSIGQCLQVPNTNNPAPVTVLTPSAYANKYLSFDAFGNPQPTVLTSSGTLTAAIIYGLTGPQTPAELVLGVVPTFEQFPEGTILRYGADASGTSDSTVALQTACNVVAQVGSGTVTPGYPAVALKIASAWTCDTNKVGIDFQGVLITTTGLAAGANWFTPYNSNAGANTRPALNRAHPIRNATIVGPGITNPTAVALNLIDTNIISSFPDIAGISFQNIAFLDWSADVRFGSGAFCIDFNQCTFGNDGGSSPTVYSVANQASFVNAGERNTFNQCFWYQKGLIVKTDNSGEVLFNQCSLDAFNRAAFANGSGTLIFHQCHVEATADTDYWFYATGTNAKIMFSDCPFVLDAVKANFPVFYSDSSCTWGGVYARGLWFSMPNAYTAGPLCAGTGNTFIENYIGLGTGGAQPGYISAAQGSMADPIFASGAFTMDKWTASTGGSGATNPAVVASTPYSGSNSAKFIGAVGGFSNLNSYTFPCRPGQQAFCQVQAQLPVFVAGAAFTGKLSYVDANGDVLTSVTGGGTSAGFQFMNITAQVSTYTAYSSASIGRAPPGTVGVLLSFSLGGGGATNGYLGQVELSIV